jgi:guanylate kinase
MIKPEFIHKAVGLMATYKPNENLASQLAQVDVIATVGPTGVGKTIIMEQSGLPYVISDTTREPRKDEKEGVDYFFRSDYDQLLKEIESGDFVQYIIGHTGEFYGTKGKSYPLIGTCTMAIVAAAIPVFRRLGFRKVTPIYIVPPNFNEWMKRISTHRDKDLKERLIEAKESIQLALSDNSYLFMVNDDLEKAVETFKNLAANQEPDKADQEHAREVALQLFAGVDLDTF